MSVPRSRILDLMKAQCKVFNTTFNPSNIRTGNKILRQRLKGPTIASYYLPRFGTTFELIKKYPQYEMYDLKEAKRLEKILILKARGKGAPKKKRTAAESKKFKARKSSVAAAVAGG